MLHFKTLHIFLCRKYLPPFFATLFIGMFIFFMIFIFTYLDEIAGKGVDALTLVKLFFYMFLTFLPPSMPLAILLSSIMSFGNLGESYELASMKSAGLSLISIMKPLLLLIFIFASFCFIFNNVTLPLLHLKAGSMLYDVRTAKPAFNLKEQVFYGGIDGYSIRVGSKDRDGKTIHQICIYDHSEGMGNTSQLYASDGQIFMKNGYLTFLLKNGTRYSQSVNDAHQLKTRPNFILHFKEETVRIDLTGLKMKNTDEELFKNHAEMMNLRQLHDYRDTTIKFRKSTYNQTLKQFAIQYYFQKSLKQSILNADKEKILSLSKCLVHLPKAQQKSAFETAQNMMKSADIFIDSQVVEEDNNLYNQAKYEVEWHKKFSLSFTCIILFFVGAPLGAIVRKGGFGMPVVISVFLFIIYHVINITLEKMVLQNKLGVIPGIWAAPAIFLPFGIWLTQKASNDAPLFNFDWLYRIKRMVKSLNSEV